MKLTIGRKDKADFPELNLYNIDIKIDSGAYTSSIHCSEIEEFEDKNEKFLRFKVLDSTFENFTDTFFSTKNYTSKIVKSSNGISETRFMIATEIIIFNKSYPIYLTLTERKEMKFPLLLGRKFLNKKFVIDTTKSNLSYKLKCKTNS